MDTSERLRTIVKHCQLSDRAFANRCDIHPATLDKQLKGLRAVSFEVAAAVLSAFPEVSSDWLLLGNGEMLRDANKETERINRLVDTIATLQEVIDSKNATIAALTERIKNLE